MMTPWGESQSIDNVADGIDWVFTDDYGGIVLSEERAALIPADIMSVNGRYDWEECVDWAVPYLMFPMEFASFDGDDFAWIGKVARETLQRYRPGWYMVIHAHKLEVSQNDKA